MLNTFTEFVSKTNLNLYNKIWYKEIIFVVLLSIYSQILPRLPSYPWHLVFWHFHQHYLCIYTLCSQRLLRPSEERTGGGQLSIREITLHQTYSDFLSLFTQKLRPRRFCKFYIKAMSLLSKHDWKQSRSVLDVWLCTLHCTLGSGHSGAGHNFPSLSERPADIQGRVQGCTVLYYTVLCITALYCQIVLSALTQTHFPVHSGPRRGQEAISGRKGSCRGRWYEASSGPEILPLSFLSGQSCRSCLRQLH